MPTEDYAAAVLYFTATETLMERLEEEQPEGESSVRAQRLAGFAARRRAMSTSRSDHEKLLWAHADLSGGALKESREFMGRTFIVAGARPEYEWRLGSEQKEFMGYVVQKATALVDSTTVEAWFTPQIPVSAGPGPYGGLPGLILVLSVDRGHELYSATEVDLAPLEDGVMTPPEEGEVVSREEYEGMVAEKLEEIGTTGPRGPIR